MLPTIALVGRPNVGKSTLFNRILRRTQALTHDEPGVTRDRIFGEGVIDGAAFALVDTGGMVMESDAVPVASKDFEAEIFAQAREAIEEAQAILLVVDGRDGLGSLDEQAAGFVRQSGKPVLLVVNKVDGEEREAEATADFHALGFEMLAVSGAHGFGLRELRERVAELARDAAKDLPDEDADAPEQGLRLALLGRPNAGKSSIVNAVIGHDRLIVSDVAGTTRDAVDVTFDTQGRRYTFVDTAGVRRQAHITDSLERFSVLRALKSTHKADVTMLVVDALQGMSRQDKRLLSLLVNDRRPFLLVVNKVDLVDESDMADLKRYIEAEMRIAGHAPVVYTSTVTRAGLGGLLPLAEKLKRECGLRVGTGELNRVFRDVLDKHQPPVIKRRRAKFYYLTQADGEPPTFVFFVNDPSLVKDSYVRYLENRLRKLFRIRMAPVSVVLRASHEKKPPKPPKRGKGKGKGPSAKTGKGGTGTKIQ